MLLIYLLVLNVYAFIVMKKDKEASEKGQWRTPEAKLWILSWVGGAPGIWLAMKKYRHKTKHRNFVIGVPILSFLTVFITGLFY